MPWKEKKKIIYFIPERWKWVGWGRCNKNIVRGVQGKLVFPVKLLTKKKKKMIKASKETWHSGQNSFPFSSTIEGLTSRSLNKWPSRKKIFLIKKNAFTVFLSQKGTKSTGQEKASNPTIFTAWRHKPCLPTAALALSHLSKSCKKGLHINLR